MESGAIRRKSLESRLLVQPPLLTPQPTMQLFFLQGAFCKLQLILRCCGSGVAGRGANAARSSAWPALHLSLSFSCGRIAAHRTNFWRVQFA